jgi:hypothetical protein
MSIPYSLCKHPLDAIDYDPKPVVYFLWYEDECVYVGQSKNLYSRVANHKRDKLCTKVSFINIKNTTDMLDVELFYIMLLCPFYNTNTIRKPSLLDKYYTFETSIRYSTVNRGIKNKRKEDVIQELFIPKFNAINTIWGKPRPIKEVKIVEPYQPCELYEQPDWKFIKENRYKLYNNRLHWSVGCDLVNELDDHIKQHNYDISQWAVDLEKSIEENNEGIKFSINDLVIEIISCFKEMSKVIDKSVPEELFIIEQNFLQYVKERTNEILNPT